jgi:hypothetical protein
MGAQFPEDQEEQGLEGVKENLLKVGEMSERGDGVKSGMQSLLSRFWTVCVPVVVLAAVFTTITFIYNPVRVTFFSSSRRTDLFIA